MVRLHRSTHLRRCHRLRSTTATAGDDIATILEPETEVEAPAAPIAYVAPNGTKRLGDLLQEQDLVTSEQLEAALLEGESSGRRLGAVLVELGILDERSLVHALSRQFNLPLVDLRRTRPEPELIALLPESIARSLLAVPVSGARVGCRSSSPTRHRPASTTSSSARSVATSSSASAPSPKSAAASTSRTARCPASLTTSASSSSPAGNRASRSTPTQLQQRSTPHAPVVQVVNKIVTQALRDRASDVHIEPQDDQRPGALPHRRRAARRARRSRSEMGQALVSRIKIMADMNIVERRRPQDGQFEMNDRRPRRSTSASRPPPTIWGEKAVLRLLDTSRSLYRARRARHAGRHARRASRGSSRSPFGMVIVRAARPAAARPPRSTRRCREINRPERNIMTIEDPVEYVFPSINQIQINEQAGITFATGLKSILRQDPDVILVGEIRDVETARIAVQSALTGHLVLSSLHATDAVVALCTGLLDMGIEPFLDRVVGDRRRRPAARAPDLHARARSRTSRPPTSSRSTRRSAATPKTTFCPRRGLQLLLRHRLPRPRRRLRGARASPTRSSSSSSSGATQRRAPRRSPSPRACARCATRRIAPGRRRRHHHRRESSAASTPL